MPGNRKVDKYEKSHHRLPVKSRQEGISKDEATHKSRTENFGNVQKYRSLSTDKQGIVKAGDDSRIRQGNLDLTERYGIKQHSKRSHSMTRTQSNQDLSPKFTPRIHQRKRLSQENVDKRTSREESRHSKSQPNLEKNKKYTSKDHKNSLSKTNYRKGKDANPKDQTKIKSAYEQNEKPQIGTDKYTLREKELLKHGGIINEQKSASLKGQDLQSKERDLSSKNYSLSEKDHNKQADLEKTSKACDEDYEDDFEDYESDFEETSQEGGVETEENETSVEEKSSDTDENIVAQPKPCPPLTVDHNSIEKKDTVHQPAYLHQAYTKKLELPTEKLRREEIETPFNIMQTQHAKVEKSREQHRSFINFASAKQHQQKQKAENKVMKRGREILELITLDEMYFDLFDMPPAKYDIYIRSFGRYNNKQVHIQTDNVEEDEAQTDEIEIREKWTQHPPHDYFGVGGDLGPKAASLKHWNNHLKTDALKLNQFVLNAGQLILMLLSEEFAEMAPSKLNAAPSEMRFSQGFVKLPPTPFTKGSSVTHLSFSSIHVNYLLTLHGGLASASLTDAEKGFICVWNLNSPDTPEYILISPSQPSCCCFGPESITTVIAGMVDGSVMIWDLRELFSWHRQVKAEGKDWILRIPTYSSAAVLKNDGHHSCVVSLHTVVYQSSSHSKFLSRSFQSYKDNMESFHILTLEDLGVLCVWVVVEIAKQDSAISETDLGLAPWGKLKLINSSTIFLYTLPCFRSEVLSQGLRTLGFQVLHSDPNHLLITTDAGLVLHCTRYSGKAKPQIFRPETDHPSKVTSLDCSIHDVPFFLVGCDDGSIRLHSMNSEQPVISWSGSTKGSAVVKVQWSTTLPSAFFVLDAASYMYVWDLTKDLSSHIYLCHFSESRIATFSMGWLPQIALALENGELHIHRLHDHLIHTTSENYKHMQQFMLKL